MTMIENSKDDGKIQNLLKTYFSFTFSKEDGETVEKQTRKTSV